MATKSDLKLLHIRTFENDDISDLATLLLLQLALLLLRSDQRSNGQTMASMLLSRISEAIYDHSMRIIISYYVRT